MTISEITFNASEPTVAASDAVPSESSARKAAASSRAQQDADAVRRFNQGDEIAFLEIVERHRKPIFACVRRLLRDYCEVEEITQDTFIRAYNGLKYFRGESSLATWLQSIALNLARNRYWYNHRRRGIAAMSIDSPLRHDSTLTLAEAIAATDLDPVRATAVDEFSHIIDGCMKKLNREQRELLTLRNIQHKSYSEISASLRIDIGTVKSRIFRARQCLRALLKDICPELESDTEFGRWFETNRQTAFAASA